MNIFRALAALVLLSTRRLLNFSNVLMTVLPIGICLVFVNHRDYSSYSRWPVSFERFSQEVLVGAFLSVVTPLLALAFGASSIGRDREDRTIVLLLSRPISGALVFFAKFMAAAPVVVGLAVGGYGLCCALADPVGLRAFTSYAPIVALIALTYLAIFHLMATVFRQATVWALMYVFFVELIIGNLPGSVQRASITYYGRCLAYARGEEFGFEAPKGFNLLPEWTAAGALVGIAAASVLIAAAIFHLREYRDLS